MGLNFNIPMPDIANSFSKGFGLTDNLMQQILGRNQLKQKDAHEKEQLAQLERHFQEQLKLNKAAAGRAAQAAADAHKKMDPMYEINQYKALENWLKGQDAQKAAQQGGLQQMSGAEQPPIPTQEMGQGMGMFSPEGMQQAQQQPHVTAAAAQPTAPTGGNPMGGLNMDLLKAHPMLRGFAKKHLGYDPLAQLPQTPEEKQKAALDLFGQKEALKMQNKGGSTPTNAVLTQNQQAVQGIDTVVPMLDELIDSKNIPGIWDFSPGKKAAYNAKTSSMIDTLIAAQSLPKVQASIDLVEEQIRRKSGETVTDYKKRLKDLRDDLMKRRGRSSSLLNNRKVNTDAPEDFSHMSDEELRKIAGGG
jgi:hypothetical protein